MPKPTRRESREIAFALMFEWSFQEMPLDEMIELAGLARRIEVDKFAYSLAERTIENRNEIDALITRYSQGWKLSRLSRTVLSVLRMSFCELTKFGDIPVGATINEAVELVKKYGTDEEAIYLNGILGSFEQVRKGFKEAPPSPVEIEEHDIQQEQDLQMEQKALIDQKLQQNGDEPELLDDIVIEVE